MEFFQLPVASRVFVFDDVTYFSQIRGGGLDLVQWKLPHSHEQTINEATTDDKRYTGSPGALGVDEGKLKNHVDEVVRSSVEETLNGLLDAEEDQI